MPRETGASERWTKVKGSQLLLPWYTGQTGRPGPGLTLEGGGLEENLQGYI